jgi:hypothetical protein
MNQQFAPKMVKFVELSSFALKKAGDQISMFTTDREKAAAAAGPLLELMVSEGLVVPEEKQGAAAMLGNHSDTLQLLKFAVDKLLAARSDLTKQGSSLGQGTDDGKPAGKPGSVKTAAAYDSLTSPVVGLSYVDEKKASDLALLKILEAPGR